MSHYLELAFHAFFIVMSHLDVVVGKTESTAPDGGNDHEQHVNVVELAQQQARHQDGNDDDDTAHRGSTLLLQLALKPQVAHNLAHLHELKAVDDATAKYYGDEERQDECKA